MTELSYLIQLQSHDNVISGLNEKASALDPLIQARNKSLENLRGQLKSGKDFVQKLQLRKKELETNIAEKENQIKKYQGELNSLKSNEAYKAMLSEIEKAKNDLSKIEDDLLMVLEQIDQQQATYKKDEDQFKKEEATIKSEIKTLEEDKAKFLADATTKTEERNKYADTIPGPLRNQYEALRQNRSGVAIVALEKNTCSGCRMSLPPHKVNEVKIAKHMVICDSCSRILYLPPEVTEPPKPASSTGNPSTSAISSH